MTLTKKTSTIVIASCISAIALAIIIFPKYKGEEKQVVIHQPVISEDAYRIERLEKAYLEAKAQLIEAQEINAYLEQVIREFQDEENPMPEQDQSLITSLEKELIASIELEQYSYETRVGLNSAQLNQIASWEMSYEGDNFAKDYDDYLKRFVLNDTQKAKHDDYLTDLRDAIGTEKAATILGRIQRTVALTEEQKDLIYAAAYSSITDAPPFENLEEQLADDLSWILSQEQLMLLQ